MADTQERLKLAGDSVQVGNNAPMELTDPGVVYIVESGEIVCFAVESEGERAGARQFLLSLGPGEAFFGIKPTAGLEVVATGNVGTFVRKMPIPKEFGAELEEMAGAWADKMAAGLARCVRAEQADELKVLPSTPAAGGNDLRTYGTQCLTKLRALLDDLQLMEGRRLAYSMERNAQVQGDAFDQLASVLAPPEAAALPIADDPLLAACQDVGKHIGMEVMAPPAGGDYRGANALRRIAKASRLRMRTVSLEENWWRQEGAPLLGRKTDGSPVALIPKGRKSYELVDHSKGQRVVVDAAVADSLEPLAMVFYRTWKPDPVGPRDILMMGLHGATADVGRIALYGFASALLALITPIATATLFNSIIPAAAVDRLVVIVIALVLGAIAAALFQVAQSLNLVRLQTRLDGSLSAALWDRLLRLPVSFFRQYTVGDLAQRALSINQIRQILAQAGFSAILGAIFSLSSLALLFVYDPVLALIAIGLVALSSAVTVTLMVKQIRKQRELQSLKGSLNAMVIQQITGVSKLRVTAAEQRAFAQWSKLFTRQQQINMEAGWLRNVQLTFTTAWPPVTTLVLFWWLAGRGASNIDPGSFLAFFAAFGQVLVSSRTITGTIASVLQAIPLFERAAPIFTATPEVDEDAADPGRLSGGVEVSHVIFRYDPDGPVILNDVSISVAPRQFVAVVGPSGAGKSSLIRLLLGFEKPEAGSVIFDDQELDTLDVELVRRQIGVVLQTAQLLPGSVYTNIAGESGLSRDDAWAAAAAAGLDKDLEKMPMGMDTLVTGAGAFSGGQKQRLLVARALATKPSLLLFDEATSALDNITQKIVTESLEKLPVTRIVIAHRLSTIMGADKIVVMVKGRVVEQGTYDELMANEGPFHELAARQLA